MKRIVKGRAEELLTEAVMLASLRHPHILQFYGICEHAGDCYIVMELAEGCVLDLVQTEVLSLPCLIQMAEHTAAGMRYLSERGVVHRDLALRNLLYLKRRCGSYHVKVTDFGMAQPLGGYATSKGELVAPFRWTAVEVLSHGAFTVAGDVWSFGVVLWELLTRGSMPYAGVDNEQLLSQLQRGLRLQQPYGCADALYAIMRGCWDAVPESRPSFSELQTRLAEYRASVDTDARVDEHDACPDTVQQRLLQLATDAYATASTYSGGDPAER
eukprot:TRINITY_DN4276_c0_g1_i1.p1 TRINITY_DN4276_c0_g1~~TRINITY_DN4276_c0_g1_i1.p1  ORF type:complete len:271 (+),score=49.57 TRINITY_DN4276_c0_g1_i1:982-1794(+)